MRYYVVMFLTVSVTLQKDNTVDGQLFKAKYIEVKAIYIYIYQ